MSRDTRQVDADPGGVIEARHQTTEALTLAATQIPGVRISMGDIS